VVKVTVYSLLYVLPFRPLESIPLYVASGNFVASIINLIH